jgi:CTP synthase
MNTQKLASNPTHPLQFAKTVSYQNKQLQLADPKSTRAMIALMDMNAVIGGAASHFGGPSAFAELMSATFGLIFEMSKDSGVEWHQKFNFVNDAGHCENGLYALRANYGFAGMKIDDLKKVVYNFTHPLREVKIGVVGKYTDLIESYKSLDEALNHGAIANQLKFKPVYIDSEQLEKGANLKEIFKDVQGILVPGGFGSRGTEGKIKAIQFARENKIPFFGICLGLQLAVIEFARNICGLASATSEEFESGGEHLIHYMEGQKKEGAKGGNMRLGSYECALEANTLARKIYGSALIHERHRHRYEFNNEYLNAFHEKGMVTSGVNPATGLVEIVELPNHPFFIGVQYHPELKSTVEAPAPLFVHFIAAAKQHATLNA